MFQIIIFNQAQLLPSTSTANLAAYSRVSTTYSNIMTHLPLMICFTIGASSPIIPTSSSNSVIQPPSASNMPQDTKKISKVRARETKKELLKNE
ncbi:hypothetical protein TNCV_2752461 [Trichonephila clavipes]|nr:hypothetical protein TNCV_2752461 [Trichonephila clavipes]